MGAWRNFCNVLGDNPILWFVPVNRPLKGDHIDGLYFEFNEEVIAANRRE